MDRKTYEHILSSAGRRIANRAAFASIRDLGGDLTEGVAAFYACYGPEDHLPENERSREGNPANAFDPAGWLSMYNVNTVLRMADTLRDKTTRDWPLELRTSNFEQGEYLKTLLSSAEARLEANDEWMDLMESLNEADVVTLFILFHGRWPNTNREDKHIADMFASALRNIKSTTSKESK
jgi:hypothetical protein